MSALDPPRSVAASSAAGAPARGDGEANLVRGLGLVDAVLLTIGSIVGTGIFLTTSDQAKVLPHGGYILLVWFVGGLLMLAGALTYAELGVMFPRAGGQYQYLKEAYGPFWGFLYGWACFSVMMSGGHAALGVGFGRYLGGFLPFFSQENVLLSVPLPFGKVLAINGVMVAAIAALIVLTAINHVGMRAGATVQNILTGIKIAAMLGLIGFGLFAPFHPHVPVAGQAPVMPTGLGLLSAFGVAMIAALWAYDGWYGLPCSAGEVRNPARNVPLGLIGGVAAVTAMYVLLNVAYLRVLSIDQIAAAPRVAETAAAALLGPWGGRLMSAAVLVSTFGCLSASLFYTARIYQPMAEDGLFFAALGRVDPRRHTPVASLWSQCVWSALLALSGTYDQLYTCVVFALFVFHIMTAVAVMVLRRRRPDVPRPYRTWGYPVVPLLFIATCVLFVANTLVAKPVESLAGVGLLLLGVPLYVVFRRRAAAR